MVDLTEASLLSLREHLLSGAGLAARPRQLVVSEEGLAYARDLARREPVFEALVRAEFPDLADSLLWPVQK